MREDDLRSGKIKLPDNLDAVPFSERYKYGLYLDPIQIPKAKNRLQELLATARNYEQELHKRATELKDTLNKDFDS